MCMLQKPNILICIFLTGILFLLTMPCIVTASAEAGSKTEDLPNKMLFQIENMKPGDWKTETYTVSTQRQETTIYALATRFSIGTKKLYYHLHLTVIQRKNTIFRGPLADFQGLEIKTL